MADHVSSLLPGRNVAPLTNDEQVRVSNTFMGMESAISVRYEEHATTGFRLAKDAKGHEYGEIIFGPDIYPGGSIVSPNALLSMKAAVAHELSHYQRWWDKSELAYMDRTHIDEALTSLDAAQRYERHLSQTDIRQLIADAMQRLTLHLSESAQG